MQSHAQREVLAFNVAGRDVRGLAAYYLARYGYYLGGGVAPRRRGRVRYGIGFIDNAVRHLLAKRSANCGSIEIQTIGGNFRRADHATTQVLKINSSVVSLSRLPVR
jgi:hypothetical protein